MMLRLVYSLLFHLAVPLVLARLWLRGRKEHGYRQHIGERFGLAGDASSRKNTIWIHAVSVGEVRAAVPLIDKLRLAYADHSILLTCMTPTGRRTARGLLADDVAVVYLPYDLPWALALFMSRHQPKMLIVMETELWPNLLAACKQRRVPAFLVNARMSQKSQQGYLKFAPIRALARQAMQSFSAVLAQSADDAARLSSLGATTVEITGNLKFDQALNETAIHQGLAWRKRLDGRKVILLASTRDHEELPLIAAFRNVTDWPMTGPVAGPAVGPLPGQMRQPLLVVVPRHPSRFDAVFAQLQETGLLIKRRSQMDDAGSAGDPMRLADVWLGDSMGEMQSYYAMCDVAIIGGSFEPLGGQNLIEAAALAKPVIMGPSTFNFSEAVQLATDANAMRNVANPAEAMTTAKQLLANGELLAMIGANALGFATAHGGATDRSIAVIQSRLKK